MANYQEGVPGSAQKGQNLDIFLAEQHGCQFGPLKPGGHPAGSPKCTYGEVRNVWGHSLVPTISVSKEPQQEKAGFIYCSQMKHEEGFLRNLCTPRGVRILPMMNKHHRRGHSSILDPPYSVLLLCCFLNILPCLTLTELILPLPISKQQHRRVSLSAKHLSNDRHNRGGP